MKFLASAALALVSLPATAEAKEADDAARWTLSLSGGTTSLENRGDQPFASIGISRAFGDSYVRLTGTHVSSRDGQGLTAAVPAKTYQISLAGGTSFGAVSLDGYVSIGRRHFAREAFQRANGTSISIASNGKTSGVGASLTYDAAIGKHMFLSPFIAVDYARIDTARAITRPNGSLIAQKEKQDGVTGSLGASLQILFGQDDAHSVGPYAAFVSSSNTTAYNRASAPVAIAKLLGTLDAPGGKDSWGEYGATASFRIAAPLRVDLSVVRTTGFQGSNSTSASAGVRFSF
jgi:Autotransporter beta-domain